MSCKCEKITRDKIAENFINKKPDARNIGVKLLGYGLKVNGNGIVGGAGVVSIPICPVEITAEVQTTKGGIKKIKVKQNVFATYCPFCGVKL